MPEQTIPVDCCQTSSRWCIEPVPTWIFSSHFSTCSTWKCNSLYRDIIAIHNDILKNTSLPQPWLPKVSAKPEYGGSCPLWQKSPKVGHFLPGETMKIFLSNNPLCSVKIRATSSTRTRRSRYRPQILFCALSLSKAKRNDHIKDHSHSPPVSWKGSMLLAYLQNFFQKY